MLQDGALNQTPVITTFKAVQSAQTQSGSGARPAKLEMHKIPASLKNIKRLSTCEDVVSLKPATEYVHDSLYLFQDPSLMEPLLVTLYRKWSARLLHFI